MSPMTINSSIPKFVPGFEAGTERVRTERGSDVGSRHAVGEETERGIVAAGREETAEVVEGWSIVASEVDEQGNVGAMFLDDGKLNGQNLLKDFPKVPPKSIDLNFDSPEGARDVLLQTCKSIRDRYVAKADIESRLKTCRAEMEKMPEGPEKEAMKGRLARLETQAKATLDARENVVRFLPTEKREVKNLNASQEDRNAIALRDIRDANVAIRNFNYDLKRTHGQYGVLGKGYNYVKQSFTTTRNGLFRWFQNKGMALKAKLSAVPDKIRGKTGATEMDQLTRIKDQGQKVTSAEIQAADSSYDAFMSQVDDFLKAAGKTDATLEKSSAGGGAPGVDHLTQTALDDIATVSEALQTQAGGIPEFSYNIEQSLLETFKGLAKGNSYKEFGLKIKGGVAVPVPITDVKIQAEYKYTFRVYGSPTGKVRIERCHAGGAHAEAGFKLGEIGKANAQGEILAGKGHEDGFVSPEDAAKDLASGKLGPLHLFFSSDSSDAALETMKKGILSVKPKAPKFDEGVFLNQARERGLLGKTDTIAFKKTTVALAAERDFKRVTGQIAGSASVNFDDVITAKAAFDMNVEGDVGAHRTEFKSYYTYFTTDRIGEAQKTYLAIKDDDNPNPLENQNSVAELLTRQPATEVERGKLANDILGELKAMIDREASYTESIKGTGKSMRPSPEIVCAHYRQATIALVALQDKLKEIGGAPDADFQKHFDEAADRLRDNLQRPGLDMTKEQLADGLYVKRSYGDDKVVLHGSFQAEAKIGIKFGAAVDVTCEIPKGDDKRPYRQHHKTTIDLRLDPSKTGLTGKAIVALVQDAYRKAARQPEASLEEQQLDAISIYNAIKRPTLAALEDKLEDKVEAEISSWLEGEEEELTEEAAEAALVEWVSSGGSSKGSTLSFQFEDGRLSSVGIGSGKYSLSRKDVSIGMVAVGEESERQSNIVKESIYVAPSFDSLMALGEEFRSIGHGTDWAKFSVKNEHAFLRMAQIVAGKDIPGDKNLADDRQRLETMLKRMKGDIEACPRREQRERLQANFQRFLSGQAKLIGYFSLSRKEQAQAKQDMLATMRMLLEAASDHYNILESVGGHGGALAIDELKRIHTSVVDGGFVNVDW